MPKHRGKHETTKLMGLLNLISTGQSVEVLDTITKRSPVTNAFTMYSISQNSAFSSSSQAQAKKRLTKNVSNHAGKIARRYANKALKEAFNLY